MVEAAYPDRSTNDIIGSIRGTFSNNGNFRDMMDKEVLAPPIEPVEGILTQEDIDKLRSMITHGENEDGEETGVVKDALGNYVAMGHVVTGVEAGINRQEEVSMNVTVPVIGTQTEVDSEMDNLYASTITGDLG